MPLKLEVIRNGFSYHETSGPAAPPRAHGDTYTAKGVADGSERGGESGGDGSSEGDGSLTVIRHALGGVAGGVASVAGVLGGALAGAVRGGFGVGRIFRRGKVDPPLGKEIAGAIGNSEVLPGSLLASGDEVVKSSKTKSSVDGEKDAPLFGDLDSDWRECEGVDGERDVYAAASRLSNSACGEDEEDGGNLPFSVPTDQTPAEDEGCSSRFEDFVSQSTVPVEEVDDENRRPDNNEVLVAAEPLSECGNKGKDDYGERCEKGLEGSDCLDGPEGVGPRRGTEATLSGEGKRALGSGTAPPRPTALQAAEADALVGEAMVTYWATFGKVSEPLCEGKKCTSPVSKKSASILVGYYFRTAR